MPRQLGIIFVAQQGEENSDFFGGVGRFWWMNGEMGGTFSSTEIEWISNRWIVKPYKNSPFNTWTHGSWFGRVIEIYTFFFWRQRPGRMDVSGSFCSGS